MNRLDAVSYFTLLAQLMKTNPPAAADAPELARFAPIGLVPGQDFDASKLNADFAKRIPQIASDRIMLQFKANRAVQAINGWNFTTKTGIYGTDYLMRALITAIGLGANRPQDAVYPTSLKAADSSAYDGAHNYVVNFPKGQLPPAEGFWSLTMYDANYFFVANPAKPQAKRGWISRSLRTERIPRRRQGIQRASGTGRQIHADDASLLAKRIQPIDPRW